MNLDPLTEQCVLNVQAGQMIYMYSIRTDPLLFSAFPDDDDDDDGGVDVTIFSLSSFY